MARKILLPLLSAVALVFALLSAPLTAQAEDNNEIGTCLAADQVWLLVVDDNGEALANQCVGTPATGTAALEEAGLQIGRDSSGFICSIGGVPTECPATFDGAFWNYYSGAPGAEYQFAQAGSDDVVPTPGTIEAWCYSTAEEGSCLPPYLAITQGGQEITTTGVEAVNLPVTGGADAVTTQDTNEVTDVTDADDNEIQPWVWWTVLGLVAAIALIMVIILISRRPEKSGGEDGPVGGR